MNRVKYIVLSVENIFIGAAALILCILLVSILLAEFHLFSLQNILWWYSLMAFVVIASVILFFQGKLVVSFRRDSHDMIAAILVVFICLFNVFFFHECFAGVRDDCVYANNVLYLV